MSTPDAAASSTPPDVVLPLPQGTTIAEFSPTAVALNEMAATLAGHTFDCTTTAGDKEARASRMALVQLRSALEAKRKELKAPHLQAGQKIDAEAARITDAILAMETKIDAVIKAEEKRKAAVAEAKAQAERARIKAQDAALMAITLKPTTLISANAAQLQVALTDVQNLDLDSFDDDYTERAKAARLQVIGTLVGMLEQATAREHEAEKMAAERAENQRIADEAAARRAAEDKARAEQQAEEDRLARQARERQIERDVVRQTIRTFPMSLLGASISTLNDAINSEQLNRPCPEGWPEDDARGYEQDQDTAMAQVRRMLQEAVDAQHAAKQAAAEADAAKVKREAEEAALAAERDRLAAQRREQEAESERQRQQREREQREREEAQAEAARVLQEQYIATASLVDAAGGAVVLLTDLGQGEHVTTLALQAAIARHAEQQNAERA